MRERWLMCVLLGTLAWGQAVPGSPSPSQPAPAPADSSAAVPATAAVITVKGVCSTQPAAAAAKAMASKPQTAATKPAAKTPAADCKTVITKAEFEKLANGVSPNVTPQLRKQLAAVLPRLIAMSNAAKKKGLDRTPQYEETVKFAKMQILSNGLQRNIQEEAAKIAPEEIEKYYQEHADTYEQLNVDRLFVPRTKQGEAEAQEEGEKNDKLSEEAQKAKQAEEKTKPEEGEQAMGKLAESLRTRAAAGEDFVKLQKEAFDDAGMKIETPTVNLPSVRRTALPPAHAAVFDLKAGDVSQVINDSGGHYIYKVKSKSQIPLDQAKGEIHSKLQNDRTREMMDNLNNSFKVETNEAYFGPAAPPGVLGGHPGPGQMPPSPRNQNQPNVPSPAPMPAPPQSPPAAQPPAEKPN
jgi:PPIC-type PPIASE domain